MRYRLLILLIIGLSGCEWIDDKEQIPSFLIIDNVSLDNPVGSGTATHEISDLWVYLDGKSLGVFPYPTHIACLAEQDISDIKIIAGIRDNGIASSIAQYPMISHLDIQLELTPGEDYLLEPVFSYESDILMRLDEGFELSSNLLSYDADNNPETAIKISSEIKRSGNRSGYIELTDDQPDVEVATGDVFINIPLNGSPIYMELDYLAEDDFFIGLIGYEDAISTSNPLKSYYLGLKASDDWKKIYVNLSGEIYNSGLEGYRIVFRGIKNIEEDTARIYLDNIRLMHF